MTLPAPWPQKRTLQCHPHQPLSCLADSYKAADTLLILLTVSPINLLHLSCLPLTKALPSAATTAWEALSARGDKSAISALSRDSSAPTGSRNDLCSFLPRRLEVHDHFPVSHKHHTASRARRTGTTRLVVTMLSHTALSPLFSQGQSLPFPTGLPSSPLLCMWHQPPPPAQGESFLLSSSAWYSPVHLSTSSTFHLFANGIKKSLPLPASLLLLCY